MKYLRKRLILFFTLVGIFCITSSTNVNAVLQSNDGTCAEKSLEEWIVQIRKMEESGGTLGMQETINTTGLLATTESNGLDCHMEKNTEYGALVILSASSYGNPNKINSGDTTTGNVTGVKMKKNNEWVAAGAGLTDTSYAKYADLRYINNDYGLTVGEKYHIGDAMDIGNWHGGSFRWFSRGDWSGLIRNCRGSVFTYSGYAEARYGESNFDFRNSSRAVVVLGSGL